MKKSESWELGSPEFWKRLHLLFVDNQAAMLREFRTMAVAMSFLGTSQYQFPKQRKLHWNGDITYAKTPQQYQHYSCSNFRRIRNIYIASLSIKGNQEHGRSKAGTPFHGAGMGGNARGLGGGSPQETLALLVKVSIRKRKNKQIRLLFLVEQQVATNQSEGSKRIIQVPGCDDCTGLGHDKNLVSIAVARLGAVVGFYWFCKFSLSRNKCLSAIGCWSGTVLLRTRSC